MRARDGAACFLVSPQGWIFERRGDAARDPGGFGVVKKVERNELSGDFVHLEVTGTRGARLIVSADVLATDWTRLLIPPVEPVPPSVCPECGRTSFGPCITRGCSLARGASGILPMVGP